VLLAAQRAAVTDPAMAMHPLSRMRDDGVAPWSGRQLASGLSTADEAGLMRSMGR